MKEILIRNEYEKLEKILPSFKDVILSSIEVSADELKFSLEGKEISILLTDDKEVHRLNKEFRGQNKSTNVLSFETEDEEMLGDIVVSIDTVLKEAKEQKKSFEAHFTHLIIHGFLHLLGFDHCDEDDAKEMEEIEIGVMEKLGKESPYE